MEFGHLEREPYLGDLLTMVMNHLLIGMILQVNWNATSLALDSGWRISAGTDQGVRWLPGVRLGVLHIDRFCWECWCARPELWKSFPQLGLEKEE